MDIQNFLGMSVVHLLTELPLMLLAGFGLWFARSRKSRLGDAASWAAAGFGLLLAYAAATVVLDVVRTTIEMQWSTTSLDRESLGSALGMLGLWRLGVYLLFLGGLAALTRAVFLGRGTNGAGVPAVI